MAVTAPLPQEPTPVEIQQWNQGRGNARRAYEQQVAQSNYGRTQADIARGSAVQGLQTQQAQSRRTFDDPYIGRGIFNSGIRGQGLEDFYTNYNKQLGDVQQQYASQVGQYGLNDYLAMQNRDAALQNLDAAEAARRLDLATQIRGIT